MTIAVFAATGLFANPANSNGNEELYLETPATCTIKIQGTYDGKSVNLTVTVEAANCASAAADFLKTWINKK